MKVTMKINARKKTFRVLGAYDEYSLRMCIEEMERLGYTYER